MNLPSLEDNAYWLDVIDRNDWKDPRARGVDINNSDLMAAFLARGSDCLRRVEGAVARRLYSLATRIIRRSVSSRHPNSGYDIVEDALGAFMEAMADPGSGPAKGLAINFEVRLRFMATDAIRKSMRWERTRSELDEKVENTTPDPRPDPTGQIDCARTVASVEDALGKRVVEDHLAGFTAAEIGERNRCSTSKVRKWIKQMPAVAATRAANGRRISP